jgi:hypothetical protein
MSSVTDFHDKIRAFHGKLAADPHHRYRSWEHCYRFFKTRTQDALLAEKDTAALHLGFYLASWGMYRGSAFLLQRAYTVHTGVVEALASPKFSALWRVEVGSGPADPELVTAILALIEAVKDAYKPFGLASDILATKVILGTMGSLPAVDRFFIAGVQEVTIRVLETEPRLRRANHSVLQRILGRMRVEQARIEAAGSVHYPLMKLADMYFWQVGYDAAPPKARREADLLG